MSEARSLKDAIHETVHDHPTLKLRAIAEAIGMSPNYLAKSALPDEEEGGSDSGCHFPLSKLAPLIRVTGDYTALNYIERILGRVAVPIIVPGLPGDSLPRACAMALIESGDMLKEIASIVEDGAISKPRAEHFSKECYEAMQQLAGLNVLVRKIAGLK